ARTREELARLLLNAGQTEEAVVEARQSVTDNPDDPVGLAMLGLCLGVAEKGDEARAILAKLDDQAGHRSISALDLARVTAGLGDRETTLRYLEQAVERREGFLPFLMEYEEFA